MNANQLKTELLNRLRAEGAVLCGVANLQGYVSGELTTGVSVAVPVPADIVEDLETAPTFAYLWAYHDLNDQLNRIVSAGAEFLREQGYRAVPNTTEAVTVDDTMCSPLPHKTVAALAGLGWIGKSCLLITKDYGASVRISSLQTDAPLPFDEPVLNSRCGACRKCVEACPSHALKGTLWAAGMKRVELLDHELCYETQLNRMEQATGIRTDLCGLCYAVCPYTKARLNRERNGGNR